MENCPKCGMSKRQAGPGSLTQWISTCRCDDLGGSIEPTPSHEAIQLCATCNKRVSAGRVGSLTQWVFRSDLCNCAEPRPVTADKLPASFSSSMTNMVVFEQEDLDAMPIVQVDEESFPSDRYRPLSEIGKGVSGIVYLAYDRLLHKKVAIKCLKNLDAEQLVAFQKEAQALSKLNHKNIIKVYDFGASSGGAPYMVMEYVDGTSLEKYVEEHGPLTEDEALPLFSALAEALEHAHSRGIFHRDVKGANVLVTTSGTGTENGGTMSAKVVDFGIATIKEALRQTTEKNTLLAGTPAYMAPDQLAGKKFDARSEVYSLGCLFYEVLTGRPPFKGVTVMDTFNQHARNPIVAMSKVRPEAGLSPFIESLVTRCLSKDPADRFQSMEELSAAINDFDFDSGADNSTLFEEPPKSTDTESGDIEKRGQPVNSSAQFSQIAIGVTILFVGVMAMFVIFANPSEKEEATKSTRPLPVPVEMAPIVEAEPNIPERNDKRPLSAYTPAPGILNLTNGSDPDLQKLVGKDLSGLALNHFTLTAEGLKDLQQCGIDHLNLGDCLFGEEELAPLAGYSNLHRLTINIWPAFKGESLKYISALAIRDLSISRTHLIDDSFKFLRNTNTLRSLTLSDCPDFNGSGLKYLEGIPMSRWFIFRCDIKDEYIFPAVKAMPSLTVLHLIDSYFEENSIRNAAVKPKPGQISTYDLNLFENLINHPNITNVALDSDRLAEPHYRALARFTKNKSLTLRGTKLIPASQLKLLNTGNLNILRIHGPCLERVGLTEIAKWKNLKRLVLCDLELTDTDLSVLSKSEVNYLGLLGENQFSDSGLNYLAKMKNLGLLRLPKVSYVTAYGIKHFKEQKPNCKIDTLIDDRN